MNSTEKMFICTSVRPLSCEELQLRKSALQDAIICMGWMKLLSIFCYVVLYLIVPAYSEGTCSTIITILILIIIPLQLITGLLLFLGALEHKVLPLTVAVWLCILTATTNTILGLVASIYFIRTGSNVLHFVIAGFFAILSLSFCSVLCHDVIIATTFIKLMDSPSPTADMISTI